jgi:hypothetical protein
MTIGEKEMWGGAQAVAVATRDCLTQRSARADELITSTRPVTVTVTVTLCLPHLIIMADALRTIKNKIKEIYGDDSVSWFDISYIVDWQVKGLF